eukprot:TRINITY_DN18652_c0_g1::TRINITY_DN18652_c0_g1_i1::g.20405::m.20405 TRINITY_DN18652_c0_g1::TRINITY_DN18652_c0_g1_i1::g.20405  ORF type:complete len:209 (-),score=-2.81,PsbH/PF00737.15/0.18,PsbH/PF00737.15/1e+04 TRINITY_DN18652_c0_g1_i1:110-736(-)
MRLKTLSCFLSTNLATLSVCYGCFSTVQQVAEANWGDEDGGCDSLCEENIKQDPSYGTYMALAAFVSVVLIYLAILPLIRNPYNEDQCGFYMEFLLCRTQFLVQVLYFLLCILITMSCSYGLDVTPRSARWFIIYQWLSLITGIKSLTPGHLDAIMELPVHKVGWFSDFETIVDDTMEVYVKEHLKFLAQRDDTTLKSTNRRFCGNDD